MGAITSLPDDRAPRPTRVHRGRAVAARAAGELLAGAYIIVAALEVSGPSLRASADAVAHGRLWLLATSALQPHPPLELVQVGLVTATAILLTRRESIGRWWSTAAVAHIGSAILAYAAIGVAVACGVASARSAAALPDYGVSCVLAGTTGALLVSGIAGLRRRPRARSDVAVTAVAALGSLVFLVISGGWYDSEHALALLLGAATAAALDARRR